MTTPRRYVRVERRVTRAHHSDRNRLRDRLRSMGVAE